MARMYVFRCCWGWAFVRLILAVRPQEEELLNVQWRGAVDLPETNSTELVQSLNQFHSLLEDWQQGEGSGIGEPSFIQTEPLSELEVLASHRPVAACSDPAKLPMPAEWACVKLGKMIGQGAQGMIFAGTIDAPPHDTCTIGGTKLKGGTKVALKASKDSEELEATIGENSGGLGLVKVYDYKFTAAEADTDGRGCLQILMEYANKGCLQTRLAALEKKNQKLPRAQIAKIMVDVLQGVKALHSKGFIHADVKPANILIVSQGEKVRAKLADFGMACCNEGQAIDGKCQPGGHKCAYYGYGTPAYGRPGFCKQSKPKGWSILIDADDLWALGRVLLQLLRGEAVPTPTFAEFARGIKGFETYKEGAPDVRVYVRSLCDAMMRMDGLSMLNELDMKYFGIPSGSSIEKLVQSLLGREQIRADLALELAKKWLHDESHEKR